MKLKSLIVTNIVFVLFSSISAALFASDYRPLTPCRVVDTRATNLGPIAAGETRHFRLSGSNFSDQGGDNSCHGIPTQKLSRVFGDGSVGAIINVTAVNSAGNGNLVVYKSRRTFSSTGAYTNTPVPSASLLNFSAGSVVANSTTAEVCTWYSNLACPGSCPACNGDISVHARQSQTHVIIDIMGYFD